MALQIYGHRSLPTFQLGEAYMALSIWETTWFVSQDLTIQRCVALLFSPNGLLENRPRQTRFPELLADERVEIVITLLFEGLGNRRWISPVYECIRETQGRLIPRLLPYNNSSRANETARFKGTPEYSISSRNSYVRFSVKLQNSDIIMFSSSIAVYQDITQDVADAFSFAFMTCSSPFSALILESSICVSI